MGATRQPVKHIFEKCKKCEYRNNTECTYKKFIGLIDTNNRCVWYRKSKQLNCPRTEPKGE